MTPQSVIRRMKRTVHIQSSGVKWTSSSVSFHRETPGAADGAEVRARHDESAPGPRPSPRNARQFPLTPAAFSEASRMALNSEPAFHCG